MASREAEFFENIAGVKSQPVDFFRLAGQCEIRGLLDDGAGDFRNDLSASHQHHQATSDREPCDRRCANPNSAHKAAPGADTSRFISASAWPWRMKFVSFAKSRRTYIIAPPLRPQRSCRFNTNCAPCGNPTRGQCHQCEHGNDGTKCHRIVRCDPIQKTAHQPCSAEPA